MMESQTKSISKLKKWCSKHKLSLIEHGIVNSEAVFYVKNDSLEFGVLSDGSIWAEEYTDSQGPGMDSLIRDQRHFVQIIKTHRKYS